jgi:hypothetical protein
MRKMKSNVSLLLAAALVIGAAAPVRSADLGIVPYACARVTGCPTVIPPHLLALLSAHPSGGPTLTSAIARRLRCSCCEAPYIVALASQANREQKTAIAQGYVGALALAGLSGDDPACCTSLACADPGFSAMVAVLERQNYAEGGGYGAVCLRPGGAGFPAGGNFIGDPRVSPPVSPLVSPH